MLLLKETCFMPLDQKFDQFFILSGDIAQNACVYTFVLDSIIEYFVFSDTNYFSLWILEYRPVDNWVSPPPWGRGIRRFGDGEGTQREKKERKKKLGENIIFGNIKS